MRRYYEDAVPPQADIAALEAGITTVLVSKDEDLNERHQLYRHGRLLGEAIVSPDWMSWRPIRTDGSPHSVSFDLLVQCVRYLESREALTSMHVRAAKNYVF